MPALAPTITQTAAADQPCPTGTKVADLATDAAEVDPGPFTYAVSTGASSFSITAAELFAAVDLTGANAVGVTVTGSDATASPETTATITVGEVVAPPVDTDDPYAGNPQIPPPLPSGTTVLPWELFMRQATLQLRPHARDGVDFVIAKPSREEPMANLHWDDVVLGPRPDAEIQALAEELAAGYPLSPVP
jgi:hypothetical protein